MAEPYIGMLIQGGWNFAPRGYALCNGQLIAISQNTALFSLLGTTYGGNGQTTFALPDLQCRAMVGDGQGAGLSPYSLGEKAGSPTSTLTINQMPSHSHTATFTPAGQGSLTVTTTKSTAATPSAGALIGRSVDGSANPAALPKLYAPAGTTPTTPLGGVNVAGNVTLAIDGGSQPFTNSSPFLAVTHVIATQGIFPSRN